MWSELQKVAHPFLEQKTQIGQNIERPYSASVELHFGELRNDGEGADAETSQRRNTAERLLDKRLNFLVLQVDQPVCKDNDKIGSDIIYQGSSLQKIFKLVSVK